MNQRHEKPRVDGAFLHPAFTRQHSPLRPIGLRQAARVLTNKRTTKRGIAMHQAFQDRIVELGVLLQRSSVARGEFSKRTDRAMPGSKVRFQVLSKARNAYSVVELATGAQCGGFNTWKEAVNFAQQLEAKPSLRLVQ